MATIKRKIRLKIYARDGWKCLRCDSTEDLTIDHIVPLSKGGTSVQSNLQTLCLGCNKAKGDRISQRYIP